MGLTHEQASLATGNFSEQLARLGGQVVRCSQEFGVRQGRESEGSTNFLSIVVDSAEEACIARDAAGNAGCHDDIEIRMASLEPTEKVKSLTTVVGDVRVSV